MLTAHQAGPNFYEVQVIATETGWKSTSCHNSQIRISRRAVATTHPHHVNQCERCNVGHQINGFHNAFDSSKKRWTINHGWLQHTQIQTTISEKYSLGHTEQIQSLGANKSESRTKLNVSRRICCFLENMSSGFGFGGSCASSELCHRRAAPQCLGLGKFERWWFVRKFPPHHGQPAICLHPTTSQPSRSSNIYDKYLMQIFVSDIFSFGVNCDWVGLINPSARSHPSRSFKIEQ